ncbi:MAG TPA: DegT/DnrJ/EryC1/StrS family aminotransferase [Bacteroidia bacterium]
MNIPYINLALQHQNLKHELLAAAEKTLMSGQFILGDEVKKFEEQFAKLAGAKYAVGVDNGTDALIFAMKALGVGKGDEVITAPNSFLASASSIALAGAKIVFADVREDFNLDPAKVEKAITKRTKAVIAVHLTGRPADMDALLKICKKKKIQLIEDCAQAVGAEYNGKRVGSLGVIGCFSLHPLKNLSAAGDGGVLTTSSEKIYNWLMRARNHGLKNRDECDFWSVNSRLDNLQAALLNVKMDYIERWTNRRREIAALYHSKLKNLDMIVPHDKENEKAVYHTFIIQTKHRNKLKFFLAGNGVDTKVHYPIPIHFQKAAKHLGYKKGSFPVTEKQSKTILSLPVYPELTDEQVLFVCEKINEFYSQK